MTVIVNLISNEMRINMTTRVFECARINRDETLVTVFARDLDHAAMVYEEWAAQHSPERPLGAHTIYAFGEERLEARPLLDAAASAGKFGVGYWDEQQHKWLVGPPDGPRLGELAPPVGRVTYFQVDSDAGDDAIVFAENIVDASKLYDEWHSSRWGDSPSWFTIATRSRWDLVGEHATLRDDMIANVTGVAAGDMDDRWRILPADWEKPVGGAR